jgi:seryl-tRNA synthetase
MREFVRIATADEVVQWRDAWIERGRRMLEDVGLFVISDVANDPFFGRGGRMLAISQREQRLKLELLVSICSDENPTAVMSCNYHQEHFGHIFGINDESGNCAETACVGFGMERIALALFHTHGLDPNRWPAGVRGKLWH